jgi:hypothetical protein
MSQFCGSAGITVVEAPFTANSNDPILLATIKLGGKMRLPKYSYDLFVLIQKAGDEEVIDYSYTMKGLL